MLKKIISVLVTFLILTSVFVCAAENTEVSASAGTLETTTETDGQTTENPGEHEDPCAVSHELVYVPAKKAGCEEPGVLFAHYLCKKCGKRFFDLSASIPITDEKNVISEPTGHDWEEWTTVSLPTATTPGLMRRVCKNTPDTTKKLKVTFDAGHGPYDNRGVIQEYYEGRRMFTLMTFLVAELSKYENIEIYTTRQTMYDAPVLASRGKVAADNGSELFISLHSNWFSSSVASGVSVYRSYFRPDSAELGTQLGMAVANVMNEKTGNTFMRNDNVPMTRIEPAAAPENGDGVTQDYYNVIRQSVKSSACKYSFIIEHGFHSNYEECQFLLDDNNLKKIAKAEADVIAKYFKLYTKENAPVGDRHVEYKETAPVGSPYLPVTYDVGAGFTSDAKTAVPGGTTVHFNAVQDSGLDEIKAGLTELDVFSAYKLGTDINGFETAPKGYVFFTYEIPEDASASQLRLCSYENGKTGHVLLSYNEDDSTVSFRLDKPGVYVFYLTDIFYEDYDVNGDGHVNNKDVTALFKYLTGDLLAAVNASHADPNKDGVSNNKDVVFLFKYLSAGEEKTDD